MSRCITGLFSQCRLCARPLPVTKACNSLQLNVLHALQWRHTAMLHTWVC